MKYRAFHKLSYGLYIIATGNEESCAGYLGNTVFQVTSDPPQIAISCHKQNSTTEQIIRNRNFTVSVLKENSSSSLIGTFGFMSGSEIDKFDGLNIITAKTGAPVVLDSAVAWFDCRMISSMDTGSHLLIIGEVVESEVISEEQPLTYSHYREKFRMLSPKNAPTYIEKEKLDAEEPPALPAENRQKPVNAVADTPDEKALAEPYICTICGFRYHPEEGDPAMGIPPGTPFEALPDDYRCPICNAGKEYFKKE